MGRRIIALIAAAEDLQCAAALESPESDALGRDAGEMAGLGRMGLAVSEAAQGSFDVLVEFATPAATMKWLDLCLRTGKPIVIGTTGHNEDQLVRIRQAAESIPVLKAANMSLGVNVMLRVARQMARTLDESYDVEITEAHHRHKVDAPSGTALALGEAVADGRRAAGNAPTFTHGRKGSTGPRPAGEIAIHSLRIGDTVGEHTVSFGGPGETLAISHRAHSRDTFAAGALAAARWIIGRRAGLYDMQDVLFGTPERTR